MAASGVVGTVGPNAIAGIGTDTGDEAAEDVVLLARQHEAGGLLLAALVEQANNDPLGVMRDARAVDPALLTRHASRLGRAGGQGWKRGLYALPPPARD